MSEIPGFERDRTYDHTETDVDAVMERHYKLTHRMELIWLALKQAGIPLSRFTMEALALAAEALDCALSEVEDVE